MLSILICSFKESKYLNQTIDSIKVTIPENIEYEILIDQEEKRTGLANTTNRYMKLFEKAKGDVVAKFDDDVFAYQGWVENGIEILSKDNKIAVVSPISHQLMKSIGIRHAFDNRIPLYADKTKEWYKEESILSGMCWIMPRSTWKQYPYNLIKNWHLDGGYANLIRSQGLKLVAYQGALIKHLGQDRWKGQKTDISGKSASIQYRKLHPEENFNLL